MVDSRLLTATELAHQAWRVARGAGVYIARFARKWQRWYHAHAGTQALVVLLVIVSFSVIVHQINVAGTAHFATAHQVHRGVD